MNGLLFIIAITYTRERVGGAYVPWIYNIHPTGMIDDDDVRLAALL